MIVEQRSNGSSSYPWQCILNGNAAHISPLSDRPLLQAVYNYRDPVITVEQVNDIRAEAEARQTAVFGWSSDLGRIEPRNRPLIIAPRVSG